VWWALIVIDAPRFDLRLRIGHRCELMHLQTFVPQPAVKDFNERISTGLLRRMKSNWTPRRRYAQSSSALDLL